MSHQLSFDLPTKPALGRSDFFVAPSNAVAVAMIDGWRDWPARKFALSGETGSGKSHLVHVWAATSGARIIAARDLPQADIAALATGPVAVEDLPDIAGDRPAEEAMFHLHNLVLAEGHALLVTGQEPPARWPLELPDLKSRMAATPHAALANPDDALIAAVLSKLFADRQIRPRPDVIPYLVVHMERSFAAAAQMVAELDEKALRQGHNVTRALAARLLKREGDD
ncbi:MAG: chromosomal replication initiator DnaA [Marinibacterium sp.]|nr:chromosomal replication initiator DnaA [Marinibacterium sp.]